MNIIRSVAILAVCLFFFSGPVSGSGVSDEASSDLFNRAVALYEGGSFDESVNLVNQFLITDGENASALNLKGLILMKSGAYKDAEKKFLKALNFSEKKPMIYYNLGLNSFNHGYMDDADRYFTLARAGDNLSFGLLFYSGLVKYALGSYDEAVLLLNEASEKNPDDPATWFNLGMSYEQVRKFDLAVKAYDNAINIDPGYEKPWFFKGRIYQSFGNESLARMAFENYTALAPEDDLGWFFYAKSLYNDEKVNESILALKKAIEKNPSNDEYKEYLSVYNTSNLSQKDELLFRPLGENDTMIILFVILIMGVYAIIRR